MKKYEMAKKIAENLTRIKMSLKWEDQLKEEPMKRKTQKSLEAIVVRCPVRISRCEVTWSFWPLEWSGVRSPSLRATAPGTTVGVLWCSSCTPSSISFAQQSLALNAQA